MEGHHFLKRSRGREAALIFSDASWMIWQKFYSWQLWWVWVCCRLPNKRKFLQVVLRCIATRHCKNTELSCIFIWLNKQKGILECEMCYCQRSQCWQIGGRTAAMNNIWELLLPQAVMIWIPEEKPRQEGFAMYPQVMSMLSIRQWWLCQLSLREQAQKQESTRPPLWALSPWNRNNLNIILTGYRSPFHTHIPGLSF